MRFPITITLGVLPVTIGTVQSIHDKGICPYIGHLFIEILAKVSYIKDTTAVFQVCVQQVCSEAFE
jgi:hypothetical protein